MIARSPYKIAVVGQVPPPIHGQAMMIQSFLQGSYPTLQLYHVPMKFSTQIGDTGRLQWSKFAELFRVIARAARLRATQGAKYLYYPPSGSSLNGVMRDLAVLLCIRPLFKKTIFHLHAGGLPLTYNRLPRFLQFLFRLALGHPDLAIVISETTECDAASLKPARLVKIYNGVADALSGKRSNRRTDAPVTILFIGSLREDKGVLVLLQACTLLEQWSLKFRLLIAGGFASDGFKAEVTGYLHQHPHLADRIIFLGVLEGEAKTQAYADADIFCFPSHYSAENFPVVLLEAMSFSLPIVSTRWRGIPEAVDESCSFLAEPRDPSAVADALRALISDADLRANMGAAARQRYLRNFSVETYRSSMERAISEALSA